jgi:predicted ArsR family transcriptional regulator
MWQIRFEDRAHREDDLTIEMAERIEEIVGEDWARLNPLRSAKHARAMLTVMHAAATGESEATVEKRVKPLRINEFVKMMQPAEDDLPVMYADGNPQMADGSSTSI